MKQMKQRRIDCEAALKQILAYIDRELGDEERAVMQGHLHTCKSCYSRMEFERLLKSKVGALRDELASPRLSDRVKVLLKNY